MSTMRQGSLRAALLAGCAALAMGTAAQAQETAREYSIGGQELDTALRAFAMESGRDVVFPPELVRGKRTDGVQGTLSDQAALQRLLADSGLRFEQTQSGGFAIVQAGGGSGPQSSGAGGDVEALIVTAQKREENIQDVPIAISAFSQEDLTNRQVAGGPDLMTQIPNFTFTKTNFTGYSIQIRGIGTQAISATTDPAVAVAFNNTPFVRNRFFEQEFYDLERIEVLRGPQGTLYGRNATAGVVNIISAKPKFDYEAKASADVGNYNSTRIEGMLNFPIIQDVAALRIAGAWTKRDGYVTNEITGNPIDGRDLWSTRVSLRFAPTDDLDVNLIWEHFTEDDDRLRSGKQLCMKDARTGVGNVTFAAESSPGENSSPLATYNQGCIPSSLYSPDSFQTPNGYALPYYQPLAQLGLPTVRGLDPYRSTTQSRDLRVIESTVDPDYHSNSNVAELQVSWDIGGDLTLQSETAYSADELFSLQDYNRFNTAPGAFDQARFDSLLIGHRAGVLTNGVFCDPQIGCSDRLVAIDLSTANSRNFSQELRLSSDYDGPFNFSFGANFTRYDTEDKYYVFINTLSLYVAEASGQGGVIAGGPYVPGVSDNTECLTPDNLMGDPSQVQGVTACIYMDPNPIAGLNDLGHNYFLSKNPYRLISYAAFGEVYYNVTESLKITGGLRYTVDKKHAPQVPSWLLANNSIGYPVKDIVDVDWSEPTGRLAIDWKPELPFTDDTLLYASYAHGYKAGGANPPPMTVVAAQLGRTAGVVDSVLHPKTFDAEFVDAFEVGTKNTLFDGRLTLNTNAFYYDYKGYQISQIIDRSAVNSNFDAEVWGLEFEADWRPTENLRLGFKGGYENTRLADGSEAIDVMDRTAGHTDWVVAKPFPSLASNCILPVSLVTFGGRINTLFQENVLGDIGFCARAYIAGLDPVTRLLYVPNPVNYAKSGGGSGPLTGSLAIRWAGYPGFNPESAPNNGDGFTKDLSGNELPNAPHYTGTLTADYTQPLHGDWLVNLHADLYYQAEAWTRVFNTPGYDKLKAYTNLNFAAIFTNDAAGWTVMAYVKNVMNRDSITGAFLNSDDSGLTTNVFLTEPRLYGVRATKAFSDVPLLGSLFGERREHRMGEPYPFTVEFSDTFSRLQQDSDIIVPDWLNIYHPSAGFPLETQDRELDTADAREIKLTYAPPSLGGWRAALSVAYGRSSGVNFGQTSQREPVTLSFKYDGTVLNPGYGFTWGSNSDSDTEKYTLAEFKIGKDVGIGAWGEGASSVVSLGVRYGEWDSTSDIEMHSDPDTFWPVGANAAKYNVHWHHYDIESEAKRSFKGIGPTLSWEASSVLLGDASTGHVDLDWSIGGGVLFGKQKASVRYESTQGYITGSTLGASTPGGIPRTTVTTVTTAPPRDASKSVQVPVVDLSLGLSYSLDWVKVSSGYRWQRYFDAIDGGIAERQHYDRTIDGPYLKLSIGFGG